MENETKKLESKIKPCDSNNPYVFISYSSVNKNVIYQDIIELQKRGVNVWIDKMLKNDGGERWDKTVKDALCNYNCRVVIFYISKDSITSENVKEELLFTISEAKKLNEDKPIPIIPVDIIGIDDMKDWVLKDIAKEYNNSEEYHNAYKIFSKIFKKNNSITRINGFSDHSNDYYCEIIKNLEKKAGEDCSVVNQQKETENKKRTCQNIFVSQNSELISADISKNDSFTSNENYQDIEEKKQLTNNLEEEIKLLNKKGNANAIYNNKNSFILLKNSIVSKDLNTAIDSIHKLRDQYADKIDFSGKLLTDIEFGSSSAAAKFVSGNSVSGPKYWYTEDGKKLEDFLGIKKMSIESL